MEESEPDTAYDIQGDKLKTFEVEHVTIEYPTLES